MDVRDLERRLDYLGDTKQAIKQSIEKAGIQVGDVSFREYADKIQDAYSEFVYPKDWPNVIKILDDDEDANRIISNGGGALIQLWHADTDERMVYDARYFKYFKTSEDGILKNVQGNAVQFNPDNDVITEKGNRFRWFILYSETNDLEGMDLNSGRSETVAIYYIKIKNMLAPANLSRLRYVYVADGANLAWRYTAFYNCTMLEMREVTLHILGYKPFTFDITFRDSKIKKVNIINPYSKKCEAANYSLAGMYVEEINGIFDLEEAKSFSLQRTYSLKDFKIKNLGISFDLASPRAVFASRESLLYLIVHAKDVSANPQTLTLGSANLAKLTNEEKQIATNKGWILQ